ncbi:MAG: DUF2569 domain-containing protein [Erythrobacter sp.]|nr:DUF2569 domain-containing protein [Erythrobacter sp.]
MSDGMQRRIEPLIGRAKRALADYSSDLFSKSVAISRFLENGMVRLTLAWLACTIPLAVWRLSNPASAVHNWSDAAPILISYILVLAAPIAGFFIARDAFLSTESQAQPSYRFAIIGRWRRLGSETAKANSSYGTVGFMVSLLIGLLLNVVFRTGEYFLAVPAMNGHAPEWGQAMFLMMTADVVIMNFFYMACFVMALRKIPLFPRMLLFVWSVDIVMQLAVANQIALAGNVPSTVVEPLVTLLNGNITKVLISAGVWLPYLILSERVNVTYRHRTAA